MASSSEIGGLGSVAHIGLVVSDFEATMATLSATGVDWSSVQHPVARLRLADGTIEEVTVRYVATSGGDPRLKIISGVDGTYFAPAAGVHHLSYWVDDLDGASTSLVAAGYVVEATGEESDGSPRYRYLLAPGGFRVELGLAGNRDEFDSWADAPPFDTTAGQPTVRVD